MDDNFDYPSVSQLCEKVFTFVSTELVGKKYIRKLADFVSLLPQNLIFRRFTLECPLAEEENWGDIMFQVDLLQNPFLGDLSTLPVQWRTCPGWKLLSTFVRESHEKRLFSGPLQGIHHEIWTEFDVGSSSAFPNKPSLFFDTSQLKRRTFGAVIKKLTACLKAESAQEVIQKCSDALFEDLKIDFIGFMLARSSNTIRLNIRNKCVDAEKILNYLSKIGISDIPLSVTNALKNLESLVSEIALDLDIEDNRLSSKIGLEFYIYSSKRQKHEKLWRRCFDILNTACASRTEKRSACLN